MKYLTVEDVLLLHHLAIEKSGGTEGLRSLELLDSAVMRCQATFDGQDLYPRIWGKTASLLHSLIKNHPFTDGNKRTGVYAALTMIELNHYKFQAQQDDLVQLALMVERDELKLDQIADWLRRHSRKIKGN